MIKSLGVCSWSLNTGSQGFSVDDLIDRVRRCGLKSIQIALEPFIDGQWDITETRSKLAQADIHISSAMFQTLGEDYSSLDSIKATGGIVPEEFWTQNQQRALFGAQTASQLGVKLVSFHAGFIPETDSTVQKNQSRETIINRIATIRDAFAKEKIRIALETGQEHASCLHELLTDDRLQSVGVNFDPANMILYGMGDPIASFQMLSDSIVQVHMKDAQVSETPGSWGQELPAGDGQVDWDRFFQVVIEHPEQIDVVIEREAGDQRVEDIIQARKLAESLTVGIQ
jgi:L-ribulose-5-phosphate 3-epimerase